ncbi:MAG: hypothetical protein V3U79_06560 [Dehalococcoidia bacterium]
MNITRGGVAFVVLLSGWTVCGMLATVGVLVLLFGSTPWGIGYILAGVFIAAVSSTFSYLFTHPRSTDKRMRNPASAIEKSPQP